MTAKFSWEEVYRILDELQENGSAIGEPIAHDTVRHYFCNSHPGKDIKTSGEYWEANARPDRKVYYTIIDAINYQ